MSEHTSRTAETVSEKAGESARRAARFVTAKMFHHGGGAAEKAGRVAHSVSEKLRSGASSRGRAALSKLTDAGIKLTSKQQDALERLKSRVAE